MKSTLRSLIAFAALLSSSALFAQNKSFNVKAVVEDSQSGEKLSFVTVVIAKPNASKPTAYALTEEDGSLLLAEIKPAKYVLKAEFLGYKAFEKEFEVKDADVDLGHLKLVPNEEQLAAAKVSAVGNPIQMKSDTISFTASSVKTTENDMLEDLLKKIPGIEISEDGSITHNGRSIDKITIDGKTFFLNDPQLASKNLPAKIVDKVKVIEKKSDQAQFTGIDDGEEETIIDLSVKPGMLNGFFGNATAGAGHDVPNTDVCGDYRYQGAAFAGKFTEKTQLAFIFNANNTNDRGFRDFSGEMMSTIRGGGMGRGQGGWGRGNGITTSFMTGLNGGTTLFNDKMDLSGNYLYNSTNKDVQESSTKTTYLEDSNLLYDSNGISNTNSQGHRFGMRMEHKFSDNTSIIFEPQINFGNGSFSESSEDATSTYYTADGSTLKTNESKKTNAGDNKNLSTEGFALLRQKLWMPGQTMTIMGNYSVSRNDLNGYNNSTTEIFAEDGTSSLSTVNQKYTQDQNSYSLWGNATFTQPLGGNFYLEANYSYSWNKSQSDKVTTDAQTGAAIDNYSNSIVNEYINQEIGLNALYQGSGYRVQVGMAAKPTKTHNYTASGASYQVDTTMTRINWAPNAMVFFNLGENGSFRTFYFGRSVQPSTSQLITIADNSNPLSVSFGNPNLSPYFSHQLRGDVRYNNKQTYASVNARWDATYNDNPIVNATWYTNGIAYTMPVNGTSNFSANFNVYLNLPIKKTGFTFMNMARVGWSQSENFVGNGIDTSKYIKEDGSLDYDVFFGDYDLIHSKLVSNGTKSFNFTERMAGKYRNDALEVELSARTRMNSSRYTLDNVNEKTRTFNNQIRTSATWTWDLAGLSAKGEFNYNWYNGYSTKQPDEYVLNLEIQKQLLNKKMTVAVKGYDILGQAKNLTVTDTANYHTESVNNTLGRYIILSLTYRFGNFGGNRGGHGGPGGPGGPPPMR